MQPGHNVQPDLWRAQGLLSQCLSEAAEVKSAARKAGVSVTRTEGT